MSKKKEPLNLAALQSRIKSDRTITTEEEAREQFWKPTAEPIPKIKDDNINNITNLSILELEINKISPDPNQPRKKFNQTTLEELANSIAERGVLNPILVRPFDGGYKLIAGERRWRACKFLGKSTIPAIVKDLNEVEAYLAAVTDNIQRENLHYLDECRTYQEMIEKKFVANQSELAEKLGVQRSRISERMKLLTLPYEVKELAYQNEAISISHAVRLAQVEDKDFCYALAAKIAKDNITVKKLDELITKKRKSPERHKASFRAVHLRKKTSGFDLIVKFRTDRPEDRAMIIEHLQRIISDLEKNVPTVGTNENIA
jgi:ParB family chromosome partitioning protein